MARVFPHTLESFFPHLWEKDNPHFSETGIPHPSAFLVAPLSPVNRLWLLALLPSLDSVGFAVEVKNPGMMQ
jgi:hypothetical protein